MQRSGPAIAWWQRAPRRVMGDGWACPSGHEKPRSVRDPASVKEDQPHPSRRHCASTHRLHFLLHPTSHLLYRPNYCARVQPLSNADPPLDDSKPRPTQLPRKNSLFPSPRIVSLLTSADLHIDDIPHHLCEVSFFTAHTGAEEAHTETCLRHRRQSPGRRATARRVPRLVSSPAIRYVRDKRD
jgi:hypothetical protein